MEKEQYKICMAVLRKLSDTGALKHLILIGSWCSYFYDQYFKGVIYEPIIKTRDLDLLVPIPIRLEGKVDIPTILGELQFLPDWSAGKGYMIMVHPELLVEFLVPEKGKGIDKPFHLPQLGVNAQTLRYLNFLTDNVIKIQVNGVVINVPHPINFALHKLIIAQVRTNPAKATKDKEAATRILKALIEKGETASIKKVYKSIPDKWQKKILKSAKEIDQSEILSLLKD